MLIKFYFEMARKNSWLRSFAAQCEISGQYENKNDNNNKNNNNHNDDDEDDDNNNVKKW